MAQPWEPGIRVGQSGWQGRRVTLVATTSDQEESEVTPTFWFFKSKIGALPTHPDKENLIALKLAFLFNEKKCQQYAKKNIKSLTKFLKNF